MFFFIPSNNCNFSIKQRSEDDVGALQHVSPTEIKIPALVSGLEEASSGLGVNVGFFLHQHLGVVFTPPLDGDVQRRLTYSTHDTP